MNNMKKKLVLFASVAIALASCQTTPKEDYSWIKKGLDVASAQLQLTAEEIDGTGKLPRSIRTGYDMDFLCRQLERDPSTFSGFTSSATYCRTNGQTSFMCSIRLDKRFLPRITVVRIRTDRK